MLQKEIKRRVIIYVSNFSLDFVWDLRLRWVDIFMVIGHKFTISYAGCKKEEFYTKCQRHLINNVVKASIKSSPNGIQEFIF